MTVRHGPEAALATEAAAVQARHFGVQRRLVDEDQSTRVPLRLLASPQLPGRRDVRPALFGGVRRFFYS